MFVTLKLEPNKANSTLQDNTLIEIDDNETILGLKQILEDYVELSVDIMDIRSLGESFENQHKLRDFFNENGNDDEVAFMLFSTNGKSVYDQTSKFVCFLRLCKTYETAKRQQQNYVQNKATPKVGFDGETVVVSDTNSEASEADDSSTEYDSQNSDSSDSDSSTAKEKERLRYLQRQRNAEEKEIKNKYVSAYPSTVQTLLFDEFVSSTVPPPKANENNAAATKPTTTEPTTTKPTTSDPPTKPTTTVSPPNDGPPKKVCSKRLFDDVELVAKRPRGDDSNATATIEQIDPEYRQFIVTICNDASTSAAALAMTIEDLQELCQEYFDCFRRADFKVAANLEFLPQSPYLYKGCVHIACRNAETRNWVLQQHIPHKWKVQNFEDFHQLQACHVVVPFVRKTKGVAAMFELLEVQNPAIKTSMWVVQDRRQVAIDNEAGVYERTSYLGEHEIVDLLVDADTRDAIEKQNFQLKYCFWKINVKCGESK